MKTLWELIDEKFSSLPNKAQVKEIIDKLEGDFEGSTFCPVIGTTFPTSPIIQKNALRHTLVVSADILNTGVIYLGFDNRVSSTNYFMVIAGGDFIAMDDFKGSLWAIASTANNRLGLGEW